MLLAYFKSIISSLISIFFSFLFFCPIVIYFKLFNISKKSDAIIILRRKYDYKDQKKISHISSKINKVLNEYRKNTKDKSFNKIKTFFTDIENDIFLKINYKFIKYFFLNKPKYIYVNTDFHFFREQYVSLGVIFLLKIFNQNIRFIGHSPDPHFILNNIRIKFSSFVLDACTNMPFIYFKKNKKKIIFPDLGMIEEDFTSPKKKRDIDILFIGRVKGFKQRKTYLDHLDKNFKVQKYGIDFNNFVSNTKFNDLYKRSKIVINFAENKKNDDVIYQHRVLGRVFDSITFGCLLIDTKYWQIETYYKSNSSYVSYNSKKNLENKVRYFLKNEKKRVKIVDEAQKYSKNKYICRIIWNNIFQELN